MDLVDPNTGTVHAIAVELDDLMAPAMPLYDFLEIVE